MTLSFWDSYLALRVIASEWFSNSKWFFVIPAFLFCQYYFSPKLVLKECKWELYTRTNNKMWY